MSEKVNEPEQTEEPVQQVDLNAEDAKAFEEHVKQATEPEVVTEDSETTEEATEEESAKADEPTEDVGTEAKAEEPEPESTEVTEDTQENKGLEERFTKLEKSYDSLQAEFTRRSQRLKALETENEQLRTSPTEKPQTESEQVSSETFQSQIVEEMKKDNPKAAHLFEAFGKELMSKMAEKHSKEIESIKNNLSNTEVTANVERFKEDYDKFLSSPLADLKDKLDEALDKDYPTDDLLLAAVRKNPNFFQKLRESVIAANFEKAAELVNKNKKVTEQADESARDKEIEKSKGAGKSKVSKPPVKDLMDLKEFSKLSNEEQEKLLRKKGLFQV